MKTATESPLDQAVEEIAGQFSAEGETVVTRRVNAREAGELARAAITEHGQSVSDVIVTFGGTESDPTATISASARGAQVAIDVGNEPKREEGEPSRMQIRGVRGVRGGLGGALDSAAAGVVSGAIRGRDVNTDFEGELTSRLESHGVTVIPPVGLEVQPGALSVRIRGRRSRPH
ncbi:MAG TPA: hypothetical protein VLB73_01790 [Patescibacteria group bacterium]|nr:hypothetical protein [Patescibacteria group bacterium]